MAAEHAINDSQSHNNPGASAQDNNNLSEKLHTDAWPVHFDSVKSEPGGKGASTASGAEIKTFALQPGIAESQTGQNQDGFAVSGATNNDGSAQQQGDIASAQAQARSDFSAKYQPEYLPKIDIGGDPDVHAGKLLNNGDLVATTNSNQKLSRPNGETLTVRADGSFDVDFKLTGRIEPGDGKIERGPNGVSRVHLGGEKDGEDVLIDNKGIISISNPFATVAVRAH